MIEQCRNLGIRIDRDKVATELLTFIDTNQMRIVFRSLMTQGEQFFQQYCHLHAVRSCERIELQGMPAHRQSSLLLSTRRRLIDISELAAGFGIECPNLRGPVLRHLAFYLSIH